jgi:hypothetical protein
VLRHGTSLSISRAYTISGFRAFPPKPEFDFTDLVSEVLENSKGLVGPHIYATIEAVGKGKEVRKIPHLSRKPPVMASDSGSRKRTLDDSSLAAPRNRSSGQNKTKVRSSAGTLKRPTKIAPQGAFSARRKDAPREDLYDTGDDSEIEIIHDEELRSYASNPKRARTDAGPRRQAQTAPRIPHRAARVTPTSTQFQFPVYNTRR